MQKIMKTTTILISTLLTGLLLASCVRDLDRMPTNDVTGTKVFATEEGTREAFAKVYGAWALTEGDVAGIDDGFTGFTRAFFNLQELPTDEAKCAWNDEAVNGLSDGTWDATTGFVAGAYYRSIIQIKYANEFLANVDSSPLKPEEKELMKAEARFVRAFQYWVLMDLYGDVPFITEQDPTGKAAPKKIARKELYDYIISELRAVEPLLKPAGQQVYGRAGQAAAQALLARVYLNAEVYTGTGHYAEAAEYADKVITAGYKLHPIYKDLFGADNDKFTDEIILAVPADGQNAQSWSGATFFVSASYNDDMLNKLKEKKLLDGIGTNGKWGGNRATPTFAKLFTPEDSRNLLLKATDTIEKLNDFNQGVYVYKYTNVTSDGKPGSHPDYCDMDFPLFRLAEMYLIYAECAARGAADKGKGLDYLNQIRSRAGIAPAGSLELSQIIDERGRELYWEGHRRTDLIRFGLFTSGSYLWEWKGGKASGAAMTADRLLYPIPASDALANPNLRPQSK